MEVELGLVIAIICILIILFGTVFAYLVYSGLFVDIEVKAGSPPFGSLNVAYKYARGPYKNCGKLFTEVSSLVPALKCIGIYYDDPEEVEPLSLRYAVGAVMNDDQSVGNDSNAAKKILQEKGYHFVTFPPVDHAVMTTFPYKGIISIMIAITRVYPRLKNYVMDKKLCAHPIMEIYDGHEILFVAPLARQEEFYVGEALQESEEEAHSDQGIQADLDQEDEQLHLEEPSYGPETNKMTAAEGNASENVGGVRVTQGEGDGQKETGSGASGSSVSTTSSFEELHMES